MASPDKCPILYDWALAVEILTAEFTPLKEMGDLTAAQVITYQVWYWLRPCESSVYSVD
jgi:hypothetical protein